MAEAGEGETLNWRERKRLAIERRAKNRAERAAARAAARARRAERRAAMNPAASNGNAAATAATPPDSSALPQPFTDRHGKPLPIGGYFYGQSIFVILSGPSLNQLDLSLLRRRGIITIGVNNSPAAVPGGTNFWTHVDPPRKFHDAIWRDVRCCKIVASTMLGKPLRQKAADGSGGLEWMRPPGGGAGHMTPRDMPNVIGYKRNPAFTPETYLTEGTVNWGCSAKWNRKTGRVRCLNVMLAVLKICYAIGFRDVYLLGCNWHMDGGTPYAFGEHKDNGAAVSNNNAYCILSGWFTELLPHFDAAGFRVWNCSPGSHLHVFPKMDYRAAVERATAGVSQDPLDCAGFYKVG